MRGLQLIILIVWASCTGCSTRPQAVSRLKVAEPEIQHVVDRLERLKPGMTRQQVWKVLGKLPLKEKDNIVRINAGSDWGEGRDSYLLKYGYSIWLRWDQTDYDNWKYRGAWLWHNDKDRVEF